MLNSSKRRNLKKSKRKSDIITFFIKVLLRKIPFRSWVGRWLLVTLLLLLPSFITLPKNRKLVISKRSYIWIVCISFASKIYYMPNFAYSIKVNYLSFWILALLDFVSFFFVSFVAKPILISFLICYMLYYEYGLKKNSNSSNSYV